MLCLIVHTVLLFSVVKASCHGITIDRKCRGVLWVRMMEDAGCTFPSFWCSSNALINSVAHLILSGLGENSSCTVRIWFGWMTCFPLKKIFSHCLFVNKQKHL